MRRYVRPQDEDKAALRWIRFGKAVVVLCTLATAVTTAWLAVFSSSSSSSSSRKRPKMIYLDVPLDYTNASDRRTARLALVMYQAGETKSNRTIVINPGGPGESGTSFAWEMGELFSRNYTDHTMDVLGFDPRGVNMSAPSYSCFEQDVYRDRWFALASQFPETAKDPFDHLRLTDAYSNATWKACDQRFNDVGRFLSTAFVARDLESIRAALGEETLSAYMISYGTNIATTYTQMFPDRVGRMVLDGIDPPDLDQAIEGFGTESLEDIDKTFIDGVVGECVRSGPQGCALVKDNTTTAEELKWSMYEVFDRIKAYPLPATHPELGPGIITWGALARITYDGLFDPSTWPVLASMLDGLRTGDGTLVLQMQEWSYDPTPGITPPEQPRWKGIKTPNTTSVELSAAVTCSDSYDDERHDMEWWNELQMSMVNRSYIGGSANFEYVFPCKSFKTQVAEVYRGRWDHHLQSPVLLIGGTHDPATPLQNAHHIHDLLGNGNSQLVEHHGYGHTSLVDPSECTEQIKRDVFLHGKMPEADVTQCFADSKPYPHTGSPSAAGIVDLQRTQKIRGRKGWTRMRPSLRTLARAI
ncbi:hypothetical protein OC835_002322 [Tilletia horrida]|nr:hypothetical protein OC835_002322 [Tilletia horrida]